MKLKGAHWFALFLMVISLLGACGEEEGSKAFGSGWDEEEVIQLTVADSLSTSNDLSAQGMLYWMNRVEELSDGRVQFTHFPAEQLGKAKSMLDYAKTGVADVTYIGVGYVSEKMPLSGVGELPGAANSSTEATEAYWQVVQEVLYEEEYIKNKIKPLFAVVLPPYTVMTTKDPVVSTKDIKGLKLRSGGGTQSFVLNKLGATPVTMSAPDTYTALERGTIDGVIFPSTSVKPYQLETIVDYITENSHLGSFVASYVINQEVYDNLPVDIKEIFDQAANETRVHLSNHLDKVDLELKELFMEAGVEYVQLDEVSVKEIDGTVENAWNQWATELDERGLKGTEVKEAFEKALGK